MRERAKRIYTRLMAARGFAEVVALGGGIVYLLIALNILDTKRSFLDEGLYLYKGLLFLSGRYTPYEDYGLWTNHMPLAFLIPGLIQHLFGAGLRTGRFFAIVLGLFMLLGLWILVRRLGGKWWAAGIVWAMALSPAEIKLYTLAISQGMIACMFVWALALTLGENRHNWQIALGALLAGTIILTRENMFLVLLVIIIYSFWQHGKKAGVVATLIGILTVILGHAFFWPNILKIWANWLPRSLTPFLDTYRLITTGAHAAWPASERGFYEAQLMNFWLTIRLHPLAFWGAFITWLLWPKREEWERSSYRIAVCLSGLFILLWVEHLIVAFSEATCVDCILLYVGFFDFLGLLLLVISFPFLQRKPTVARQVFIMLFIVLAAGCIAASAFEDISNPILNLQIPRIRSMQILPGTTALWTTIENKFGLAYRMQRFLLPTIVGLLFGIVILLLGGILLRIRRVRSRTRSGISYGFLTLNLFLIITLLLSPTVLLSKGNDFYACGPGTLEAYETAGAKIHSVIGSNVQVYWEGRSGAIFLYLPGVEIYPPQLNHWHSLFIGGDPDALLRMSRWNIELGRKWLGEADYILIEGPWLQEWEKEVLQSGNYERLAASPALGNCKEASRIYVYRKKP